MRKLKIALFFLLLLSSCNKGKNRDISEIDNLLNTTDSLLEVIQNQNDYINENFYTQIDDSLFMDSLSLRFNLPDTMGFYQYLEHNIKVSEELFTQTKQEIFFAKDQLESLKFDFQENNITESEYLSELQNLKEMLSFLKERVDSSMHIINELSKFSAVLPKDSSQ